METALPLKAAVCAALYAALSAEALGAFGAFGPAGIAAAWALFAAGALWLWRRAGAPRPALEPRLPEDAGVRFSLWACAAVAAVCLLTALLSPPNNYDSMTYHMPRVMHWLQNGSMRFFPTQDLREICFPPGSSYLIAELQALTGGDRLASFQQWASLVLLMAGAAVCARRLGGSPRAQALAAALAAGMPMAVLESTTAQNDLFTAVWVVSTLAFALADEPAWACAALALANLAKPTGLMFGGPVLLVGLAVSERPWPRRLALWSAAAVLALAASMPHYWRNAAAFGRPLGAALGPAVAHPSPAAAFSNALRDLALQIPVPAFWRWVISVHRRLGLDPNDRATSLTPFLRVRWGALLSRLLSPDEDFAASPVQFVLIACGAAAVFWRKPRSRAARALIAAMAVGGLAFCALVKWQEWGNRLVLPLMALGLPLAALFAAEAFASAAQLALAALLALTGVACDVFQVHHPLVPLLAARREDVFFFSGYGRLHADAFRRVSEALSADGCRAVGLDFDTDDDWEYPWWALNPGTRFKRVSVSNASASLPQEFPDSDLCAVILARGPAVVYFDRNDLKKLSLAQIHATPIPLGPASPEYERPSR